MTYMHGLTDRQKVALALSNEDKGVGSNLSLIYDRQVLVAEVRRLRALVPLELQEPPEPIEIGESPVPPQAVEGAVPEVEMEKAP